MGTDWVIASASERLMIDDRRQAEATFTVTNAGRRSNRAIFDVIPGDGADKSWFHVEDPQRLVQPAASVAYLVGIAVPDGTQPGSYSLQGMVHSADSAPEESSATSARVNFEVGPSARPAAKPRPGCWARLWPSSLWRR
jgi:hypothetical protein